MQIIFKTPCGDKDYETDMLPRVGDSVKLRVARVDWFGKHELKDVIFVVRQVTFDFSDYFKCVEIELDYPE